jgi:hypothetical protein
MEEEQQVGLVAGFLGLRYRREEDDDGENEEGSRGARRPRVA